MKILFSIVKSHLRFIFNRIQNKNYTRKTLKRYGKDIID